MTRLGRTTGFAHRLREVTPHRMAIALLTSLSCYSTQTLADILLQDGSSFAVVDALKHTSPGRFTTVSPAAVELHATMSRFHDQASRVHLAPDADGERQFLPAPGDLRRTLILADRGYMDIAYCRHVHHAGGSFIVRFKTGVNPVVVRARVGGRERVSWRGKHLAAERGLRSRLRPRPLPSPLAD